MTLEALQEQRDHVLHLESEENERGEEPVVGALTKPYLSDLEEAQAAYSRLMVRYVYLQNYPDFAADFPE